MKYLFLNILIFSLPCKMYAQKNLPDSVITETLLQNHVKALAHDSMQGRFTGTEGCNMAADYIANEMASIGIETFPAGTGSYFQQFKIADHNGSILAKNVVGLLPGKISNRFIIFSAHYDHVGMKNNHFMTRLLLVHSKGDTIYNGANDNASGVAALLALARYFKTTGTNNYSILFIAFSGEELGLLGSQAFANNFPLLGGIRQVINLEMLGRPHRKVKNPVVTEGLSSMGFARFLNKSLIKSKLRSGAQHFTEDLYPHLNFFSRSDNFSFALKGIPANTIMAANTEDRHYHAPSDEWHTLNYKVMQSMVKLIALAMTPLVMTEREDIK